MLTLVSLLVVAAASSAGHTNGVTCSATEGQTVLQAARVRVYQRKNSEVRACLGGGRNVELANAFDELTFRPPAMSISNDRIAYGHYYNDVDDLSATTVRVADLRRGRSTKLRSYAASKSYDPARVVRTSLQSNGTIVWSVCASDAPPSIRPFNANRCPTGPGDGTDPVAEIRVGYPDGRVRTLDASNAIDPRSVQVRRQQVSWMRGSTTRSARLR